MKKDGVQKRCHYFSRLSFDRGLRISVCGLLFLLRAFCFSVDLHILDDLPFTLLVTLPSGNTIHISDVFCVLLFIKITRSVVRVLGALLND